MRYTSCPRLLIPPEVHEFMFFFEFTDKGDWPAAGGLLNQPRAFLDAVRYVRSEEASWRAKYDAPVNSDE